MRTRNVSASNVTKAERERGGGGFMGKWIGPVVQLAADSTFGVPSNPYCGMGYAIESSPNL